jgi:hypothetical protein
VVGCGVGTSFNFGFEVTWPWSDISVHIFLSALKQVMIRGVPELSQKIHVLECFFIVVFSVWLHKPRVLLRPSNDNAIDFLVCSFFLIIRLSYSHFYFVPRKSLTICIQVGTSEIACPVYVNHIFIIWFLTRLDNYDHPFVLISRIYASTDCFSRISLRKPSLPNVILDQLLC